MTSLTDLPIWDTLKAHQARMANEHMRDMFAQDAKRFERFSLEAAGLLLDYSKNRINTDTINTLCELALECQLPEKIAALLAGKPINITEKRAALHTALRRNPGDQVFYGGIDVMPQVQAELNKMEEMSDKIRAGLWYGYAGQPITDIVNIGIGGSDLGPLMASQALTPYSNKNLRFHFVSNVDGTSIKHTLDQVLPETTLFIISSKSFQTIETLTNANTAKRWFLQYASDTSRHFMAVTAHPERAQAFGIEEDSILRIWDWVGGRFSIWSAIGFPLVCSIGMHRFKEFLAGARAMDAHFASAPLTQNMPVLLGLIGVWYVNFFDSQTQAILPYNEYLKFFPRYLKQLDMESNGKTRDIEGGAVDYATGPIVWGEIGCNGQHAFHQLLHQGSHLTPADFIIPCQSQNPIHNHHAILFANCLSQSQALMLGKTEEEAYIELRDAGMNEFDARTLAKHKVIPGDKPSNTILFDKLTPERLGALLALYEHKAFVQGVIWGINSFDQMSVEFGKGLSQANLEALEEENHLLPPRDSSTRGLFAHYRGLLDQSTVEQQAPEDG
jgi:glucose-6-phosphate isomerase